MSKNRPNRPRLKIEGTQDADRQRLKNKPTPTQAITTNPERLSLFFSLNSCFYYAPTAPTAYFTGKFINFATPKHFSDRPKRL